ncbi:MAG: hypothetical protein EXR66_00085 [Dehalococcoidia bacterium]|nr:hypothetical protein [Dehalococcoidia bacterium]
MTATSDGTRRPEPERFIIAARLEAGGEPSKYLLVRWRDWPPPALLSVEAPAHSEAAAAAVEETIAYRLGVRCIAGALLGETRTPARMRQGARGGDGMGWLRAAAVRVEGEPVPDALLEEVLALTIDEALAALTSDVERQVFLEAAGLLGDTPSG